MRNKFTIIILILALLSSMNLQANAESKNYQHLEGIINDYYSKDGGNIVIEPHGSRDADILGVNKDGNKIVGEIKKAAEIDRDLNGYWSQWNSKQNFGGKTSDYQLANQYTDKGASLSRNGRGWAAVIDGQLRGYCVKKLFGNGDLLVENFSKYEGDIKKTLDYLKQQGRIKSFEIESVPNSNMARIRILFDKLPATVLIPKQKGNVAGKIPPADTKETLKQIGHDDVQKGSKLTESTKPIDLEKSSKKILPKTEFYPSTYSKIITKVMKASVAFSILFSGYTMTKEVYEKMMTGTKIHPSRVLARGIVGFAGAIVGGIVLAALLGIIALPTGPFAFVVAIIASLVGSIAGGIGAEWLFEWLVPMNGVGWATGDFLLGGLLGSIMGVFPGTISGYILARIVNARVQPPKMPPKAKTFLGKLENAGKIIWRKGKHWYEKEARESDYMWRGAFLGLFFGGLFIAMTFVYLFN